jgi:hypothetical protein
VASEDSVKKNTESAGHPKEFIDQIGLKKVLHSLLNIGIDN